MRYLEIIETRREGDMRDWIEQKRTERRNANIAKGINIGDFVQMDDWFGDIWAEVVSVSISADVDMQRYASVDIIVYEKYGRSRNKQQAYLGDIRAILPAAEAATRRGEIFHTIDAKRGGNSLFASWPTQAGPHTRTNPGGRDGGKEWHPDVPADERSLNFRPRSR
jgi:hypothetical protein